MFHNFLELLAFIVVLFCVAFAAWNSPLSGVPVDMSLAAHSHMTLALSLVSLYIVKEVF